MTTYSYEDSDLAFRKQDERDALSEVDSLKAERIRIANEIRDAANCVEIMEPEEVFPIVRDLLDACVQIHEWSGKRTCNELELQRFRLSGQL